MNEEEKKRKMSSSNSFLDGQKLCSEEAESPCKNIENFLKGEIKLISNTKKIILEVEMDALISEIMTKLSNIENRSLSSEEYESLYAKLNEPGWDQNPEYAELKQYFLELYQEQRSIGGQRKTTFASRPAYCSGAGVNCHSGHFQGAIVTFGRDQEKYLNCRCFRWEEASFEYEAAKYKNYNFKSNLYVAGACEYKASPSSTPQYWSLYGGLYETPYTSLPDGGKWYSAKRKYKFNESKGKIHLWRGHISPDTNFYGGYRIKVKWPFRPSSEDYHKKKIKYPFECSNDQLESPYYNGPLSCSPGFVVCQPYIKILRLSPRSHRVVVFMAKVKRKYRRRRWYTENKKKSERGPAYWECRTFGS